MTLGELITIIGEMQITNPFNKDLLSVYVSGGAVHIEGVVSMGVNGECLQLTTESFRDSNDVPEKVQHAIRHLIAMYNYPKEAKSRLNTAIELLESYKQDIEGAK